MICFICKVVVNNLHALVAHFKIIHLLKPDSTYTCCEAFCSQSFNCLSSFKRHILKKYVTQNSNNIILPPNEQQNNILNNEISNDKNNFSNENNDSQCVDNIVISTFDFENSVELLYQFTVKFILSLHNSNNFNISDVMFIQSEMKENVLKPMASVFKKLVEKEINEPLQLSKISKFETVILVSKISKFETVILDPFIYCSTEHHLNNWLRQRNLLSPLHQFTINNEIVPMDHAGNITYDEKITKGALLPIKQQFKWYFEHDNNFKLHYDELLKYEQSDSDVISNFVQGKLWKEKITLYEGKIVFPYFLYVDEFEVNNPLGSHANVQSIAAVYYNFPLATNNSKLSSIFLAALIKSIDIKEFGNDKCFKILINELNELENIGLNISTEHGDFRVHFLLGLVLGDNLGLNSLLEFSKSFSANYYCRFCKIHKSVANELYEEDASVMRNIQNYSEDVAKMCFSETGIYNQSIMNSLNSFHVTNNFCADSMHDIFEGVCHYDMCHIIKYYISTVKLFSLTTLNNRKANFNCGTIEVGNISPNITELHLNKFHLKMTAREMMTFVQFFSLMVGDLIPDNCEVWNFFLTLLKIVDLIMAYTFTENSILNLKQLIKQHNYLYVILFGDNLKPKHHFLIHYPTIIQYSGPPRSYWCMRFEGKHKEIKMYARSTCSRKKYNFNFSKKNSVKICTFYSAV